MQSALSLQTRMKRSQIPDKWVGADLTAYQTRDAWGDPDALLAVVKWCDDIDTHLKDGRGLFLYGAAGSGKSLLACIVANAVLAHGGQSYWLPVQDLVAGLYAQVTNDDIETARGFDRLMHFVTYNVQALVLDDMARERISPTQYTEDQLDRLIRARGNKRKITIITSNATPDQFKGRYGAPMESYIHEICQIVHVQCPDYRAKFDEDKNAQ